MPQDKIAAAIAELEAMIGAESGLDIEKNHSRADDILCELLNQLGHEEVVRAYQKIDKWYA